MSRRQSLRNSSGVKGRVHREGGLDCRGRACDGLGGNNPVDALLARRRRAWSSEAQGLGIRCSVRHAACGIETRRRRRHGSSRRTHGRTCSRLADQYFSWLLSRTRTVSFAGCETARAVRRKLWLLPREVALKVLCVLAGSSARVQTRYGGLVLGEAGSTQEARGGRGRLRASPLPFPYLCFPFGWPEAEPTGPQAAPLVVIRMQTGIWNLGHQLGPKSSCSKQKQRTCERVGDDLSGFSSGLSWRRASATRFRPAAAALRPATATGDSGACGEQQATSDERRARSSKQQVTSSE